MKRLPIAASHQTMPRPRTRSAGFPVRMARWVVAVEHAIHVVVPGDTLSKLAKHYYGDAQKSSVLFAANSDFPDEPDQLFVGQRLRVPSFETESPGR
jgi:nucleoid-associated protein YgaU